MLQASFPCDRTLCLAKIFHVAEAHLANKLTNTERLIAWAFWYQNEIASRSGCWNNCRTSGRTAWSIHKACFHILLCKNRGENLQKKVELSFISNNNIAIWKIIHVYSNAEFFTIILLYPVAWINFRAWETAARITILPHFTYGIELCVK